MRSILATFALALTGASAASLLTRGDQNCCFELSVSGSPVEQLSDGQLRIHQTGLPGPSTFCLNNGDLTDSMKRGCIVTPPTSQIQCDSGASSSGGFSVSSSGMLLANGSSTFYACPTGDNGGYNIYTAPLSSQSCQQITLTVTGGNCVQPTCSAVTETSTVTVTNTRTVTAGCSATAAPPPPATTTAAATSCPTTLTGNWQYPHLIVPINSSSPDTAYGTSYFGTISSTVSTIFDFDIPQSYAGKTCTVVFLFPTQSQLTTSSYTVSGSGMVDFYDLASPATQQTTYDTCPAKEGMLTSVNAQPGNSYVVGSGPCAAGERIGILAQATGSYSLHYFQDYNPSPIGLYITSC